MNLYRWLFPSKAAHEQLWEKFKSACEERGNLQRRLDAIIIDKQTAESARTKAVQDVGAKKQTIDQLNRIIEQKTSQIDDLTQRTNNRVLALQTENDQLKSTIDGLSKQVRKLESTVHSTNEQLVKRDEAIAVLHNRIGRGINLVDQAQAELKGE